MPTIKSFIFFDLEATGLHGIGEKPRITELSMVATHRMALLDMASGYPHKPPRVMDKLTLCVYPMKPVTPSAAVITGLYNDNLLQKKDFDENLVQSVNLFIQRQEPPVCMVAHNGLRYDYPLLKAELEAVGLKLDDGVLFADSLTMLRELDAEEEAENLRKQKEMLKQNQETPTGPVKRSERTSSLGFESSGISEDRLRSVKRKLFDDESTGQKKIAVERKNSDENDNVIEESEKDVITISDDESSGLSKDKDQVSQSQLANSQVNSQASNASTIICDIPNESIKKDETHSQKSDIDMVAYSSEESTSEETTPAKNIPSLIQKLSCTETISEDSGSDMELGRKVLQTMTWSSSLPDDVLTAYDLDAAVKEHREKEKENGAEKREDGNECEKHDDGNRSEKQDDGNGSEKHNDDSESGNSVQKKPVSIIDQMTPEKNLLCPEEKLKESPMTFQIPISTSSHNNLTTNIQEPASKLEACRRNLQIQVANVKNTTTNQPPPPPPPVSPGSSTFHKPALSYKLGEVYSRLFGSAPVASHRAEDDCMALLLICQKKGEKMVKWCEEHAVGFEEIEPMYKTKGRTPLKLGVFPHH